MISKTGNQYIPQTELPELEEVQTGESTATETPQQTKDQSPEPTSYSRSGLLSEQQIAGAAQRAMLFDGLDAEHRLRERNQTNKAGGASDVLMKGSSGPAVKELQNKLNEWRAANGKPLLPTTGFYGDQTEAAVKEFQEASGLEPDGKAGPNTKTRLDLANNPNFQKLDPEAQEEISKKFASYQKDPIARDNLMKLATDPNLAKVSKESQLCAIEGSGFFPHDGKRLENIRAGVRDLVRLEDTQGFKDLSSISQEHVRQAMIKACDTQAARDSTSQIVTDNRLKGLNEEQVALAVDVLRERQDSPACERNNASMNNILSSDNFKKLSEEQKTNVLKLAYSNAKDPKSLETLAIAVQNGNFF